MALPIAILGAGLAVFCRRGAFFVGGAMLLACGLH